MELAVQAGNAALATASSRPVRRWLWSTGKAAWIVGSTLLVAVVPLVIELDREQQLMEMENQQLGVLTQPAGEGGGAAN